MVGLVVRTVGSILAEESAEAGQTDTLETSLIRRREACPSIHTRVRVACSRRRN